MAQAAHFKPRLIVSLPACISAVQSSRLLVPLTPCSCAAELAGMPAALLALLRLLYSLTGTLSSLSTFQALIVPPSVHIPKGYQVVYENSKLCRGGEFVASFCGTGISKQSGLKGRHAHLQRVPT